MQFNPISPTLGSHGQPATSGQEGVSINDALPSEMIKEFFSRMPSSADSKVVQVCRSWNDVVQINQPLRVFGEEIWSEYLNFEVEGKVPAFPKGISKTVRSDRERLAGKKAAPFCTAILMPKGLTPNRLIELMKNPKKGYSTEVDYSWPDIIDKYGDKAIEKSYWFVVTNDVIEGTKNKSYKVQEDLIKGKTNSECELPTYLEALVCCGMHHVIYEEHLLGRERPTWTRSKDLLDGDPVVVGGFGGLRVGNYSFDNVYRGALACRKFC